MAQKAARRAPTTPPHHPEAPVLVELDRVLRIGTRQSSCVAASPEGHSDRPPLELAIASVVDRRRWLDWGWLDQDRALHQP